MSLAKKIYGQSDFMIREGNLFPKATIIAQRRRRRECIGSTGEQKTKRRCKMSESKQEGSQSAGTLETQPTLNGYETKNSKRNHIHQDRFVRMERILDKIDSCLSCPVSSPFLQICLDGY